MIEQDGKEWGNAAAETLVQAVAAYGEDLSQLGQFVPVEFTESTTKIRSVRSEYLISPERVQFHFWGEPEFPKGFPDAVQKGLSMFPKEDVLVEYVPEVGSWYTQVANLQFGVSPDLVERLLAKVSAEVG
jgi:hypothetical protein